MSIYNYLSVIFSQSILIGIVNTIGTIDDLIENYQLQMLKICDLLKKSLLYFEKKCTIDCYEPIIIKSGIFRFDNMKIYLDTSSVEGINNISNGEIITFSKHPSRANMQPIENSVWFAKMKSSNKVILITKYDTDLIDNYILSTGFLGIKATNKLPLSLLTAIIITKDFNVQRDLNSVGTTMAGVNNETFMNIQVPKLSKDEIIIYDNKYNSFVPRLSYLRRQIKLLKDQKEKLLNKYFK